MKSKMMLLLVVAVAVSSAWGAVARAAGKTSYQQTGLVSDTAAIPAPTQDSNLKNPWGVAFFPGGPIWINDNATGLATVYDGTGAVGSIVATIPPPPTGSIATPTGIVANPNPLNDPLLFPIPGHPSDPAQFIFATEDGTIAAWNFALDPANAVIAVDHSQFPTAGNGAVYKGLALGNNANGVFLYATNFRSTQIDVFDANFAPVALGGAQISGRFADAKLPGGPTCDPTKPKAACYAPFGIANIRGNLFVTYAEQDATKQNDVPGKGHGYVDVFDTGGNLIKRFATKGALNSPWGIAAAPFNFGSAGGTILIGNLGDGRINSFSSTTGAKKGALMNSTGKKPVMIDGLWGLTFGGFQSSDPGTLYFTAGPNNEADGLFGALAP